MKRDGNGKYTWAFLGQYPDPDPNLWVFDDFEMLSKTVEILFIGSRI